MEKKVKTSVAIVIAAAVLAADGGAATTNTAIRVGTCNVRVAAKKDAAAGNGWKDRKGDLGREFRASVPVLDPEG